MTSLGRIWQVPHLSAWNFFSAIQFIPTSLSWVLKIRRKNTERLFTCQYSSCAICWSSSPSAAIPTFICLGNAAAHWTAEMSFLRASHEFASLLNALCWHILKIDIHISQGEANKSCMWHLFLALPQRALHDATLQLSLLILWPCWTVLTTLHTGTFMHFTVLRLGNNPDNYGIYSLIRLSLGLLGPAALFSLLSFSVRQANPFESPVIIYMSQHLEFSKILHPFHTHSPLITIRREKNILHPIQLKVWASYRAFNCVQCERQRIVGKNESIVPWKKIHAHPDAIFCHPRPHASDSALS